MGSSKVQTNKMKKVNSNVTEAINDIDYKLGKAQVPIPSVEAVEDAKDWVDNGSHL